MFFISLVFASCNDETNNINESPKNARFQKENVYDKAFAKSVKDAFNLVNNVSKNKVSNFNFDNITKITDIKKGTRSYIVNSADENINLGIYEKNDGKFNFLIVETSNQGVNKSHTYKNVNKEEIIKVVMNTETEKISIHNYSNSRNWGQDTIDCITDGYSNHGWVSVTGWVITAFQPWFAVGMAAGCAALTYE